MSHPPETPENVLHPTKPLWAVNAEEDPRSPTGRKWHAIETDRGTKDDWHQFQTRCGRSLEGVMSSIRTSFDGAPEGDPTCDECLKRRPITPSNLGDTVAE